MLIKGLRADEYVIQVNEAYVIGQAGHQQFHDACELAGGISETKTKNLEAPLPFSRDKSSLVAVALIYLGLPVTPMEVTGREEFAAIQSIQASVDLGQGKLVFDSQTVQLAIINA